MNRTAAAARKARGTCDLRLPIPMLGPGGTDLLLMSLIVLPETSAPENRPTMHRGNPRRAGG